MSKLCKHHDCRCARAGELAAMGKSLEAVEIHKAERPNVTCRRPVRCNHPDCIKVHQAKGLTYADCTGVDCQRPNPPHDRLGDDPPFADYRFADAPARMQRLRAKADELRRLTAEGMRTPPAGGTAEQRLADEAKIAKARQPLRGEPIAFGVNEPPCPRCNGTGDQNGNHEREWSPCAACDGTGQLRMVEGPPGAVTGPDLRDAEIRHLTAENARLHEELADARDDLQAARLDAADERDRGVLESFVREVTRRWRRR